MLLKKKRTAHYKSKEGAIHYPDATNDYRGWKELEIIKLQEEVSNYSGKLSSYKL